MTNFISIPTPTDSPVSDYYLSSGPMLDGTSTFLSGTLAPRPGGGVGGVRAGSGLQIGGVPVEASADGIAAPIGKVQSNGDGTWTINVGALPSGSHAVLVSANWLPIATISFTK